MAGQLICACKKPFGEIKVWVIMYRLDTKLVSPVSQWRWTGLPTKLTPLEPSLTCQSLPIGMSKGGPTAGSSDLLVGTPSGDTRFLSDLKMANQTLILQKVPPPLFLSPPFLISGTIIELYLASFCLSCSPISENVTCDFLVAQQGGYPLIPCEVWECRAFFWTHLITLPSDIISLIVSQWSPLKNIRLGIYGGFDHSHNFTKTL